MAVPEGSMSMSGWEWEVGSRAGWFGSLAQPTFVEHVPSFSPGYTVSRTEHITMGEQVLRRCGVRR